MNKSTETPLPVGSDALFDSLQDRKFEIERRLLENDELSAGWIDRPDCAGWWLWLESCHSYQTSLMLVGTGGTEIADDDEWEKATGKAPDYDMGENYWEGTQTTQEMMPGLWLFLSNAQGQQPAE